jgi:hypothetical protein
MLNAIGSMATAALAITALAIAADLLATFIR